MNSSVEGIEFGISKVQFAEDTTFIWKTKNKLLRPYTINEFSSASGLCLNIHKCELLPVGLFSDHDLDIPVKNEVKYFSITVYRDQVSRSEVNTNPLVYNIQKKLIPRLQRNLILITKADGLSRVIYSAMALDVPQKICRRSVNSTWRNIIMCDCP